MRRRSSSPSTSSGRRQGVVHGFASGGGFDLRFARSWPSAQPISLVSCIASWMRLGIDDRAARRRIRQEELGGRAAVAEVAHLVDRGLAIALGLAAEAGLVAERREQLLDARGAETRAHALRVEQRGLGEAQRAVRIARSYRPSAPAREGSRQNDSGPSIAVKPSPSVARSTHSTSSRFAVSGSPARCSAVARSR